MTTRQSIITALVTLFETITTANGYSTNLGQHVEEWKTWEVNQDTKTDTLVIRDTKCDIIEMEEDDNAGDYHFKRLTVQAIIITSGTAASETLRTLLDDVYRCIGTASDLGGLAIDIECEGDQTDIDRQARTYGGTLVTLAILYRVVRWRD